MSKHSGRRAPSRLLVALGELDPEIVCGATTSFMRAAPELERRGWSIRYWTEVPSATQRMLEASGATVDGAQRQLRFSVRQLRVAPGSRARLRGALRALRGFDRVLRAFEPDVVLGNTVGALPELIVARRRRGIPTVLHALEVVGTAPRHRLGMRALSLASDEIMVPSEATARQFAGVGRAAAVAHTGIEVPDLAVSRADARMAERRTSGLVAGAIGKICRRKGSDLIVAAARLLAGRGVDVELRMAGRPIDGTERPRAEAWIDDARAAGITYREHVDTLAELPTWDVLVVPSREDPFPNVVLEALAIGVPVVAASVGGIPEQIGDAGILVEPEDPAAIAESIAELAADPRRRAALAAAGRRRVATLFTPRAQAARTEEVLVAAFARRGRPDSV